ncbi:DUF5362 family protein [Lacibacter sediminis]|uniref:DUF5362 domain-containing protein n=1 Tax=Lacibacter sediminis TaxID=2760713 RepID=A0A7G5XB74_9BACT|nr:DUF5362 family protein [Lacibacter sediminis]QNA42727.1 hypothetical protein H4075_11505 [Lacibacter sediminis]
MDQNETTLFKLEVEELSTRFLSETAKWGKFLSIVGFIFIGLIVILAIFAGTLLGTMAGFGGNAMLAGGMSIFITILYLAIAALYFFPCLYMFRFSTRMKRALAENNQELLNSSFENLKSCFKFMGIMTIVFISIYVLAFLVGTLGSLGS